MLILINTMYVIPFPGIFGSGITVNLNLGSSRIVNLQETTKLDDVDICFSLREFFKQFGGFCPSTDEQLNWNSELLKYIHGETPFLNELLLHKLSTIYRRADFSDTKEAKNVKVIPFDFWIRT